MLIKMLVVLGLMMGVAFAFQKTIVEIIERPLLAIDPESDEPDEFRRGGSPDHRHRAFLLRRAGDGLSLSGFVPGRICPAGFDDEGETDALSGGGGFLWSLYARSLFAYYFVLPPTLDYFFNYSKSLNWRPQWSVREYFSFTTQFIISFGLAFEFPLAVLLLVKLEILSYEVLQRTRAFAVIIILFLAAIITPTTDILTLILMAGPMYLLYEGCIFIAWLMERKARRQSLAANSTRG